MTTPGYALLVFGFTRQVCCCSLLTAILMTQPVTASTLVMRIIRTSNPMAPLSWTRRSMSCTRRSHLIDDLVRGLIDEKRPERVVRTMCALRQTTLDSRSAQRIYSQDHLLGVPVEGDQRAILLRLLGLWLPAGSRHCLWVEGRLGEPRVAARVATIHVRLLRAHDVGPGGGVSKRAMRLRCDAIAMRCGAGAWV